MSKKKGSTRRSTETWKYIRDLKDIKIGDYVKATTIMNSQKYAEYSKVVRGKVIQTGDEPHKIKIVTSKGKVKPLAINIGTSGSVAIGKAVNKKVPQNILVHLRLREQSHKNSRLARPHMYSSDGSISSSNASSKTSSSNNSRSRSRSRGGKSKNKTLKKKNNAYRL